VTGFYSRTLQSADSAATFTKTNCFKNLEELVSVSDTIFITTPDGEIKNAWNSLVQLGKDLSGYIICHFSGSLSSLVFSGAKATGASCCSIHPMYAFSDKYTSHLNFHTAYLTIEGSERAVFTMKELFEKLGHKVLLLNAKDKTKYHSAAVLASNAMVGLFQSSIDILADCGFSEKDSQALLAPLVEENVKKMLSVGCVNALTGPVERADSDTVKKHLEVLSGSLEGEIYRNLTGKLIEIAKIKNPDRDYSEMEEL
jgi:predicted short-subunit dehydrogenase-like oxidoreductase (DUF2520 family)